MKLDTFTPSVLTLLAAMAMLSLPVTALHAEVYYFAGANTGGIPDNDPNGRIVTFDVSGLDGPITSVELESQLSHTWFGDISATLYAPSNVARLRIFGRTRATTLGGVGTGADLAGSYRFSDDGGANWWAAATGSFIAPGRYRTTTIGGSANGGCPTSLVGAFGGLTPVQAGGQWELRLTDRFGGDAGSISSATLIIATNGDVPGLFSNGFEAPVGLRSGKKAAADAPAHCINKVRYDFTGNGRSDLVLAKDVGGSVVWNIRENLGAGSFDPTDITFTLGTASTDYFDAIDIDGDRIADPVAWTGSSPGVFHIRRSTRPTSGQLDIDFGQTQDDPQQSGDYDGDGLDDLAVVRAPSGSPGPITLRILLSSDGSTLVLPIGTGSTTTAFSIGGFDYSGDGIADIAVQRTDTIDPTKARFRIYDGQGTGELDTFLFGKPTDLLIPGNHVGSTRIDITAARTNAGNREWYTRDSATGIVQPVVLLGIPGDQRITGDYDGDGLDDYANWHPSSTPGASQFEIRPSTNTATTWQIPMGSVGDLTIGGSRIH